MIFSVYFFLEGSWIRRKREENESRLLLIAVMESDALVTLTHDNGFFRDCWASLTVLASVLEIQSRQQRGQSMLSRLYLELKSSSSFHQVSISGPLF